MMFFDYVIELSCNPHRCKHCSNTYGHGGKACIVLV
uniref:Uncharacterized protein n=1 Tax=Arundo donax TaxID=35708 RepID=A0A0A9E1I3_ARUDO